MEKIIYFFYIFFQGIILFQLVVFIYLYKMSKRAELLYYSFFLFLIALNFFISDPSTFGWGEDDVILNSYWYKLLNTPLVICANIFYVLFLKDFYSHITQHRLLFKILRVEFLGLLFLLVIFFVLFAFGIVSNFLFNILNSVGIIIGVWMVIIIIKAKLPYTKQMAIGFIANLTGTLFTVAMLILLSQGVRHLLVYDYPFVFVKLGVLIEIFFFNIAIFKKWHFQEKELAVQQLEKKLALEKVRNEISCLLHDDIGSTLSGVSMYSHLANNSLDKNEKENTRKSLLIIQQSTNEMVDKLGDLVWSVNPKHDSLSLLFDRLEQFATQMCAVKNIKFSFAVPSNLKDINIPQEHRHHLYLMMKEAINNAVKYSEATKVNFEASVANALLTIAIADNGKGFDANKVLKGNGLDGMQKRAEEMGAEYALQSKIGEGTSICMGLTIPQ
jgi:signal transduction histidine kinase